MRRYLHIHLQDQTVHAEQLAGEALVKSGRYLIAKTLVEAQAATVDPLGPENRLIFSAGPFAGTSFSNANRTSVGCKSPLTGGIKEANSGGTFAYGLGRLEIADLTLHGQSASWVVIHLHKDGSLTFADATPYLRKGNVEATDLLRERYGQHIAVGLCGPVGEYQGLLAGITFTSSICSSASCKAWACERLSCQGTMVNKPNFILCLLSAANGCGPCSPW